MTLRFLCSFFVFFLPIVTEGKIIETHTIEDVIHLIDKDAWLIVDLDNTTFEGKQALGHTEWFYDKAYRMMREQDLTLEEATRECYPEWIEIQRVCPVKPVEEAFITALNELQKQGHLVMGLTHRQPSLVDSTLRQLNSIGLNFHESAPSKNIFSVPSSTPTMYRQGVLFTGEYNKKGEIFVRFLSIIDQKPKKVVFIDDKRSHVEDVNQALQKIGVEYLGIHYKAIELADKVYYPELAEFQHKFLNKIMSNDAAMLLMQNGIE